MLGVEACELPDNSLLRPLVGVGVFADCYSADLAGTIAQAEYVEAFYTTALFTTERRILRWLCGKPSTDLQAKELAMGERDTFSAWTVEARSADQLLLRDFTGSTRSWLMTRALAAGGRSGTRLYFGSAVLPRRARSSRPPRLALRFRALLGFHKLYSRLLLVSARARLGAP